MSAPFSALLPGTLRQAEPHPWFGAVLAPVRLALGPLPAGQAYTLSSYWEERPAGGAVQRTGIEKNFHISAQPAAEGLLVSYTATAAPGLRKPAPTALERALLLLADLYQHLELQVAPSGQLLAVLNEAEVQHTWQRVRAELQSRSGGGEDEITQLLLAGVDEQLRQSGSLLASLRYDYQFAFLLKNIYQQRFESSWRYGQALVLPQFFAGLDLWCHERLELRPPPATGRVALHLSGELDRTRTDPAAVVQQMLAAQAAAGGQPPTRAEVADLRLTYEADYEVDAATGWPLRVEASVRCWLPDLYSKEYFIRLEVAS